MTDKHTNLITISKTKSESGLFASPKMINNMEGNT